MHKRLLFTLMVMMISTVSSKSFRRDERDLSSAEQLVVAASNRQLGGGLSALGTLVSPLLFLMGMGSFISMLPQMFQTVLSGVGSNLIQSFTGGAAAAAGGSSSRLRRNIEGHEHLEQNLLDEIERRLNMAVLKNERPNI